MLFCTVQNILLRCIDLSYFKIHNIIKIRVCFFVVRLIVDIVDNCQLMDD